MSASWLNRIRCAIGLASPAIQNESGPEREHFLETQRKAELGDPDAQMSLSTLYNRGLGVKYNEMEWLRWLRKAAEQNHVAAQYTLGCICSGGSGIKGNDEEAAKWLLKAAERNHRISQSKIGNCFAFGRGVERDDVEAVRWWLKAAEQNDRYAQFHLGVSHAIGRCLERNEAKAVSFWCKAAEQSHTSSAISLVSCYKHGRGTEKNLSEAYAWLYERFLPGKSFVYLKGINTVYGLETDDYRTLRDPQLSVWLNETREIAEDPARELNALKTELSGQQILDAQGRAGELRVIMDSNDQKNTALNIKTDDIRYGI